MRKRHLLVVERNADVRGVLCELLQGLGFRVDVAKDVAEMRAWVTGSDPLDLIVLDASLRLDEKGPPVDWARDHGIRVVMMSGHPAKMVAFHERDEQLLHKPIRRADLELAVQLAFASDVRGQRVEDPY